MEERHDDILVSTSCRIEAVTQHSKTALMPEITCCCLLSGQSRSKGLGSS